MHWSPEHAQPLSQWPEQHLDVSSTTSSPAHKAELCPTGRLCYIWANDDISALTASNLLKRYAERYAGVLDAPYDHSPVGSYTSPGALRSLSDPKTKPETWPLTHGAEGYPGLDGQGGAKATVGTAAAPPSTGSTLLVNGDFSDSGYSAGSSCGGTPSQDYPFAYNSTYLTPGSCPQSTAPLPTPSLHTLQPASPLVPSFTPPGPIYNYIPSSYSHQTNLAPTYTHPPASHLSSGLAAPPPLPPLAPVAGCSYGYESHNQDGTDPGVSLKRKALEMTGEDDGGDGSHYRKHGFNQPKPEDSSPYNVGNTGDCPVNGFGTGSTDPQTYKHGKPASQSDLGLNEVAKYSGLKPLVSSTYGDAREYNPSVGLNGDNGEEHGLPLHHFARKPSVSRSQLDDVLKSTDPKLLELVTTELRDCSPSLAWGEVTGHTHIKAALEEDVLWPALRPGPASCPPRTVLLFGPRGGGKTTLARCLASQLGATFFQLRGAVLAPKWKSEGEKILRTLFLVAGAQQPSVVLISEVEALMEDGPRQQVLNHLETVRQSGTAQLVVCATRRPDMLEDAAHHRFAKSYYVGLPDVGARKQVLLKTLAPLDHRLSEQELGTLLQRTEGFSVLELLQLCQQAATSASTPAPPHNLTAPFAAPTFKDFEKALGKVRPYTTSKDLDVCLEWSKAYSL